MSKERFFAQSNICKNQSSVLPIRHQNLPVSQKSQILFLQRAIGNNAIQQLIGMELLLRQESKINQNKTNYYYEIIRQPESSGTFSLGPFTCKNGQVTYQGAIISISALIKYYKDLSFQEKFQNNLMMKLQKYITTYQNSGFTIEHLFQQVYNTVKGTTGGATTTSVRSKEPLLDWWKIGTINLPEDKNPFYKWAAALHEQVHHDTIETKFKGPFKKTVREIKADLLQGSNLSKELKAKLQQTVTEKDIVEFIVNNQALLTFEKRLLQNKMNQWYDWIDQAVNFAGDDLKAYQVSLAAIKKAKEFIRLALPPNKRKLL